MLREERTSTKPDDVGRWVVSSGLVDRVVGRLRVWCGSPVGKDGVAVDGL